MDRGYRERIIPGIAAFFTNMVSVSPLWFHILSVELAKRSIGIAETRHNRVIKTAVRGKTFGIHPGEPWASDGLLAGGFVFR